MLNSEHLNEWFGLPVELATRITTFDDAGRVYRFGYDYGDEDAAPAELFAHFLASPSMPETQAIIFGMADESGTETTFDTFLDALEPHAKALTKLRGLFLGDIVQEENEMSGIHQGDLSRALTLFPALAELRARGQDGLTFSPGRHIGLTTLIIETGGMPKAVLEGLQGSVFPNLERLELWLGTEEYGFDGTIADVLPFMQQGLFPKLKHLTLGNSDIADEIAQAIAEAPILAQLESLDLSLGTMTDAGAEALVNSPSIRQLKSLNLHRNYLSPAMCQRLQGLGIEVDTDGQEEADVYDGEESRYVAVGE